MPWVDSGEVRLHTQSMGAGPLLVMCHGLITASLATWYFSAAPALTGHYTVLLYDLRGHGRSSLAEAGYDLDSMADDLGCVIESHYGDGGCSHNREVVLVGHSYGALVALTYALRHPQQLSRLVLIDAPLPAAQYVLPSLSRFDSAVSLEEFLSAQFGTSMVRSSRAGRRQLERLEFLLLRSSLRHDLSKAADVPDTQLEALTVPTLCMYGRHSDCADAGKRLARLLPRSELRWVDSDHFVPTQATAVMIEHLVSYLT